MPHRVGSSQFIVCIAEHDTEAHRALLADYLIDRWGIFDPAELIEQFGVDVVTEVVYRLWNLGPERFRSPSGFFVYQCRKVAQSVKSPPNAS